MIFVRLRDGSIERYSATKWEMSEGGYLIATENRTLAIYPRESVLAIYRKLPNELKEEVCRQVVERIQGSLMEFIDENLQGVDLSDAQIAMQMWLQVKAAEILKTKQ